MATKITTTSELNVTLSSADDVYRRTVKISNPLEPGELTWTKIQQAFEPAFAVSSADSSTGVYFFLDDTGSDGLDHAPMVKVLAAEKVDIEKEVRRFDASHEVG